MFEGFDLISWFVMPMIISGVTAYIVTRIAFYFYFKWLE